MATISTSGTWTTISFTTSDIDKTDANVPKVSDMDFSASLRDTNLSELDQFIQLVADAYSIGHWSAAMLIRHALAVKVHRESPTQQNVYP